MLSTLASHIRHNVVAYLALFLALGGTAVAAKPLFTGADIQDGSLTDADVAAENKDGTAGTPSLRRLGTGAQQAAAGNDARLSDARTPTGAAGGDLAGTYPNPRVAGGAIGTAQFSSGIPAVRVSGQRSLPAGSSVTISFASEAYDTADMHDGVNAPAVLFAPVEGVYSVTAQGTFFNADAGGERSLQLITARGNVVTPDEALDREPGEATTQVLHLATEVKLPAGGAVLLGAGQSSGSTFNGDFVLTMSWIAPG